MADANEKFEAPKWMSAYFGDGEAAAYFNSIVGLTFSKVEQVDDNEIRCWLKNRENYIVRFAYWPDCCAQCRIEDIAGDLSDLVGSPITMCEVASNIDDPPKKDEELPNYEPDSYTWSFLKLATRKGYVTVRWYGESNGYYSERPEMKFEKIPDNDEYWDSK